MVAICPLLFGSVGFGASLGEWEFGGFSEVEARAFAEAPAEREQFRHFDVSLALEPELFRRWDDPDVAFVVRPFVRLDWRDAERTHGDVRELMVHKVSDRWELKGGVGKVFWGVAESQHLVDVINQTDFVENIDGEEKLGQPMLNFTWITEGWGTWNLFYLPYFRERTFPGEEGRLRSVPRVEVGDALYESGLSEWHPDASIRWSQAVGDFDLGAHYFYGTSRDPAFRPEVRFDGEVRLRPVYNLMHQVGVDAQWTREGWLWKFEGVAREGRGRRFQAAVAGLEYTLYGVMDSSADVGLIGEHHYSTERDPGRTWLNNDVFAGARYSRNDAGDTALLGGVFYDYREESASVRVEFERRLGDRYTLEIQGQWFARSGPDDVVHAFRRDSFLQVAVRRYF